MTKKSQRQTLTIEHDQTYIIWMHMAAMPFPCNGPMLCCDIDRVRITEYLRVAILYIQKEEEKTVVINSSVQKRAQNREKTTSGDY